MPTLACPHCRYHVLETTYHQNVEIDVCTHCGGIWFDNSELEQVIRQYDPQYPRALPIAQEMGECIQKGRLACPSCRASLDTYEFETASRLQVDICEGCQGIWLDKGELPHAKAYYEIPEAMQRINRKRTAKHWFFQFLLQLPVEFNIAPRRTPAATLSLMVFNLIFFLALLSNTFSPFLFPSLALVPETMGTPGWAGNLITYQFLHSGLLHLAGNMYFLYILGDNLEDALGRFQFVLFYLVCGAAGGIAQSFLGIEASIPIVGASGAIAGLMAGYLYTFRKAKLTFFLLFFQWKMSPIWYFSIWVVINILGIFANSQNVAWFAHLGGFAAGLGIIAILYPRIIRNNPLINYLNHTST